MSIIAHNFGAATSKSERLSNDGCTMEIKEIKPLEFNRSMQQIADNCNIKYIYIYIDIHMEKNNTTRDLTLEYNQSI